MLQILLINFFLVQSLILFFPLYQGFRKVDPDRWEFANEGFLRGCKSLLKNITRRKPAHGHNQQRQPQLQKSAGACVEVGKFGLEEEVEQLKRDKNVLMQELVRLRQHQQATDQQMQTVGQRVQVMEQRQQQMMSFLAKAMHSPGFLAQLVPQKNENNMRIGGNKKRRLPRQDEEDFSNEYAPIASNGLIIKYQPSINEAAKAMMSRILKMASPSRFDQSRSNRNAFLIDDVLSSNSLYSESPAGRISGLTCNTTESVFPVKCTSAAISETQSCPVVVTEGADTVLQDGCLMDGVVSSETSSKIPNVSLMGSEPGHADKDLMSGVQDGTQSINANDFSPGSEKNSLMETISRLPSINDVFWEQFFTSPVDQDADEFEIDGSLLEDPVLELDNKNEWEKTQHMDHITEQMELLASDN